MKYYFKKGKTKQTHLSHSPAKPPSQVTFFPLLSTVFLNSGRVSNSGWRWFYAFPACKWLIQQNMKWQHHSTTKYPYLDIACPVFAKDYGLVNQQAHKRQEGNFSEPNKKSFFLIISVPVYVLSPGFIPLYLNFNSKVAKAKNKVTKAQRGQSYK